MMGLVGGRRRVVAASHYANKAVHFAGITGATLCRRTSDLATGTAATIACWVNLDQTGSCSPFTHYDNTNFGYYLDINASTQGRFTALNTGAGVAGQTTASSATAISTNAWHLLVGGFDAPGVYFSLDGGTYLTSTNNGFINAAATTTALGGFGPGGTGVVKGSIDSAAIWNRRLTQTEVGYLWNSGVGLAYWDVANNATYSSLQTSLLAWWDADDTAGDNLTDATGNGKILTGLNGTSTYTSVAGVR